MVTMYKNKNFIVSLLQAFNGLKSCIRTEKNAKFHLAATIIIILLASFLSLKVVDWLLILLAISLVWISELFNTAIEYLFDVSQPEIDPRVKYAKDISAAAVLVAAVFSIVVGILILGPPLYRWITNFFG